MNKSITVSTVVNAPISKVWEYYTKPEHIVKWNNASVDWHTPKAENDLRVDGRFLNRMEAKDGSAGFDFGGIYTSVIEHNLIKYKMDDNREVEVNFIEQGESTKVGVTFDLETFNSEELQRGGWQAILNNFKLYTENS
jgi:uncharacterized protein YndB with AHSA1/START domain